MECGSGWGEGSKEEARWAQHAVTGLASVCLLTSCSPALAENAYVTGRPRVVDGDTLQVWTQAKLSGHPPPHCWQHAARKQSGFHAVCHKARVCLYCHRLYCVACSRIVVPVLINEREGRQVSDERIRLYGIDAPESKQMCKTAKGVDYACGKSPQGDVQPSSTARSVVQHLCLNKCRRC